MKFRLAPVFYLFALLAAAMAVFGPLLGVLLATLAACAPSVFRFARDNWPLLDALVVFGIVTLFVLLLAPAVHVGRSPSTVGQSMNNIKQWVLAMHHYHDDHGVLPPAYSVNARGDALHSWRTMLLPYAEHVSLAKLVHQGEPWDNPANRAVMGGFAIESLRNPRARRGVTEPDETQYLGVVGDKAVLVPGGAVTFRDIADGLSNTIVLIEVVSSGIAWHEPRDLTIDEAAALLCGETVEGEPITEVVPSGFFTSRRVRGDQLRNRCVAFADGSCLVTGLFRDRESARAFLTRAGGEERQPLPDPRYIEDYTIGHIVRWGRVWGVVVFAAIALMPAVRRLRIAPGLRGPAEPLSSPQASAPAPPGSTSPHRGRRRSG